MPSYAKLFSSIVHSTVWREPNHVRIVWVTMLALANKHGLVEASVPGLADAARVSLDECKAALAALEAPDPYSRTQDYDGRRIAESDGGWLLLNYSKYRALKDDDLAREKTRERVRRYRERHKVGNVASVTVTPGNVTDTRCNPIPETSTSTRDQHQRPENGPPLPPVGEAASPPVVGGNGHGKLPAKGLGAATERELARLLSDERVCSLVDAWAKDRGRSNREIGVARAATAALAGGYQPDQLALVSRLVALAGRQPERFPDRGSLRWAAQNKPAASYVWRSDALDKLIPECEAWDRA